MAWKKVPPELVAFLEQTMAAFDCERKTMFGCPAYFVNNYMFVGAHQESLFLRLSEPDRDELLSMNDEVAVFEPMEGRKMKEYVVVPDSIYNHTESFNSWLQRAYAYASSLPEKKPRKRGK